MRTSRLLLIAVAALLALVPPLHAAPLSWQPIVGVTLLASVLIIALLYALARALSFEKLKALAREEAGQAIFTALVLGAFIFALPALDQTASQTACSIANDQVCHGSPDTYLTCQTAGVADCATGTASGWALALNDRQSSNLLALSADATGYANTIGLASAKTGFVSSLGVGMGIAGCSAFGVLRGPITQMINAVGFGLMDLQSEKFLLGLQALVMGLLLPAGILLRALHITRKAGGAVIALSLSFYLMFPAALVFGQLIADSVSVPGAPFEKYAQAPHLGGITVDCDPFHPDEGVLVKAMQGIISDNLDALLFWVILRTLLMTAFALTVTLGFARALAPIFSSDIDVSAIARLS